MSSLWLSLCRTLYHLLLPFLRQKKKILSSTVGPYTFTYPSLLHFESSSNHSRVCSAFLLETVSRTLDTIPSNPIQMSQRPSVNTWHRLTTFPEFPPKLWFGNRIIIITLGVCMSWMDSRPDCTSSDLILCVLDHWSHCFYVYDKPTPNSRTLSVT